MVWKQGSDRTSLLSLIVIDRETEPSPAHHSSECKPLVDILCKQHSLLKRSSFSVNTDLCNLAQHCSVRFKPQEQANEVVCSWCEGGSVTYKVPLRCGSSSLKTPSARAAEKLETTPRPCGEGLRSWVVGTCVQHRPLPISPHMGQDSRWRQTAV